MFFSFLLANIIGFSIIYYSYAYSCPLYFIYELLNRFSFFFNSVSSFTILSFSFGDESRSSNFLFYSRIVSTLCSKCLNFAYNYSNSSVKRFINLLWLSFDFDLNVVCVFAKFIGLFSSTNTLSSSILSNRIIIYFWPEFSFIKPFFWKNSGSLPSKPNASKLFLNSKNSFSLEFPFRNELIYEHWFSLSVFAVVKYSSDRWLENFIGVL